MHSSALSSNTRAERSAPIPTGVWEKLKDEIEEEYVVKGHTQDHILAWLREKHVFAPSTRQLTLQLSKWDFYKKKSYLRPKLCAPSRPVTTAKQQESLELAICEDHLMPNASGKRCAFCAFRGMAPDRASSRGRMRSVFAIPDARAMVFLQHLGLVQHATSSAAAYWEARCQKDSAKVTEGQVLAPSLNALTALRLILQQTLETSTFRACECLLTDPSWRYFVKTCPKSSYVPYWLALHAACKRLEISTPLITNSPTSKAETVSDARRVKFNYTTAETSLSEPYNGPRAIHIKLYLAEPDQIVYLTKPRTAVWYPENVQLEDDFKLVIDHCLDYSSKHVEEDLHIFVAPKKLHVTSSSIFELVTTCFEIFYGGHLEVTKGSLGKNRPIFEFFITELASALRQSEKKGRNLSALSLEHEHFIRSFINIMLVAHRTYEHRALHQEMKTQICKILNLDSSVPVNSWRSAYVQNESIETPRGPRNMSKSGIPEEKPPLSSDSRRPDYNGSRKPAGSSVAVAQESLSVSQAAYDPFLPQAKPPSSFESFKGHAKEYDARRNAPRSASQPSERSRSSLGPCWKQSEILRWGSEIKSRQSETNEIEAISDRLASSSISDGDDRPRKIRRISKSQDSGSSLSINFGIKFR